MWLSFPKDYTAVLVNNGTFLGEVLEVGSHEWRAGDNAWLLEKGGFQKALGKTFKTVSLFGGQVITQQEIIFIRMQPLQEINSAHKMRSNTSANVTNNCSTSVSTACLM